jgi:hypothetical protein
MGWTWIVATISIATIFLIAAKLSYGPPSITKAAA